MVDLQGFSYEEVSKIVFNVVLPEGVELVSKPKDKSFFWKGELVKGENIISLYVKALKQGNWNINAKVQADGIMLKELQMPIYIVERKG